MADWLMVPKDQRPYWDILPRLVKSVFWGWGLVQLLILALFIFIVELFLPLLGHVIATGIYAGYMFFTIQHAAGGKMDLPDVQDFQNVVDDIVVPFLRLTLVSALLYAPTGVYLLHEYSLRMLIDQPDVVMSDPVLIAIIAASMVYYPGAVITAALGRSTLQILNPVYVVALIWRIPLHYLITVVFWSVLLFVHYALTFLIATWFQKFYVPFLQAWFYEYLELIVPVLMSLILGRLIYQNAVKLGHRTEAELFEPEYPDARPSSGEPGTSGDSSGSVVEFDPRERRLISQLWLALDSADDAKTLESFRSLLSIGSTPELDVGKEIQLAQLLEHCGEALEAARAYRRAAEKDPRGPEAPEAILEAGRLLLKMTDKLDTGLRLLEHLIQQYPHHEAAVQARQLLNQQR